MTPIQINSKNPVQTKDGLLSLGFRIFFLGASVFSILSIFLWMNVYVFNFGINLSKISIVQWHAHEMVYGYCLAVIAGFLLTAVNNWTGIPTLSGIKLLTLFILWATARVLILFGTSFILLAGSCDLLFMLGLTISLALPIIQVKQWKQMGVLSKIILLSMGNLAFYLGALSYINYGVNWGIYGGLYLVIGLILTIGRRVIPMFTESGVGYSVKLFNSKWIDLSSLIFFLAFFIVEVFIDNKTLTPFLTAVLFIITSLRLVGWHTAGIWQKPLLWSLFISLLFIDLGFLLFTLSSIFSFPKLLAIHAFSYGGIGLITLSMMSRVTLGHTGRSVHTPPKIISYAFLLLIIGTIIRVIIPIFDMNNYLTWILSSQVLWMIAFLIFLIAFTGMLIKPSLSNN